MAVEGICTSVGAKLAELSVDKAIQEARYLCCYQSYVNDFDEQRKRLSHTASSVHEDIKDARDRNETRIDPMVEGWLREADTLIEQDTEEKTKCFFGMCTNWIWKNRRSKELEGMVQKIADLIQNRSNFPRVARKAGPPGMKYYSSPNFMYFESRKKEYEQLKEALRNERNHMIGLQGMGGTGKTEMEKQVGIEVEESNVFDIVIFVVVSTPPDVEKIQSHIARHLGLTFEEGKGSKENALSLWSRIAEGEQRILIILDDVWDKDLNLKDIGIPHGQHHKGRCSVLISTRDLNVCEEMGCEETIKLGVLHDEDAVNLFLFHVDKNVDHSSNNSKEVALAIVKECGRLPVAIVAMARALKKCSIEEWRGALRKLKNSEPNNVPVNLKEVYNSLKLSYDNLGNEEAKSLFLLCSLFPEDFEMPMLLFSEIAIGLGFCGEADEYYTTKSQVREIRYKLIDSCLLLEGEKECMKMHDLVHEVALWIGKEETQVIMDSQTDLKNNVRYLSWFADGLPNRFDSSKLEFLLVQISPKDCREVEVPDSLFEGMMELRVLLFICTEKYLSKPAPSLLKSIQILNNIRTLILTMWSLENISIMGNLQTLEALELNGCSITEFPIEIRKLKKLRLLGLIKCVVFNNNPFEVIEWLQLEELYYINNGIFCGPSEDEKLHCENRKPLDLQRYHIEGWGFGGDTEQIASTLRCFIKKDLNNRLSKATLKSLVAKAEILVFGEYYSTGWRNLITDISPMEEDGLIRLSLYSFPEIECLIYTKNLQSGSGVSIFSKLVELELYDMDVKELCCGPFPKDFLKKLKELCLQNCLKLEGTLFKEKLDLGNLKLIRLHNCSMTSLLYPSSAQSLQLLETLEIYGCYKLKFIIMDEASRMETANDHVLCQKSYQPMFPKLRFLDVRYCGQLECLFPMCFVEDTPQLEEVIIDKCGKLKYIFGQYQEGKEVILPSLKKIVILRVPDFINIYPKHYHPVSSSMQKSSQSTRDGSKVKDPSPSHTFSWAPMCCFLPKSSATSVERPTTSEATLQDYSGSKSQGTHASKTEWIFDTAECVLRQSLNPQDMRDMEISSDLTCSTSMFTQVPITSLFLMERLAVEESNRKKEIITDRDDGHEHINYEFRFVLVSNADGKLRYMLKRCSWEDNPPHEIHDDEYLFSWLAQAVEMPPKTLKHLYLENEEIDMIYDSRVQLCIVKEVNVRTMKLENLPIRCLYEGNDVRPFKYISKLEISGCQRLKFIIPESISEDLMLSHLVVSNCQDLEYIVEQKRDLRPRETSLHGCYIEVSNCKRLKSLFPISGSVRISSLKKLKIEDAPTLEQVFGCEQAETNWVIMERVCPELSTLQLINLPSLRTVFQGNDFQKVKHLLVHNCPRISQTSSTTMDGGNNEDMVEYNGNLALETGPQLQEDPYYPKYEVQVASPDGLPPSQIKEREEPSVGEGISLDKPIMENQSLNSEHLSYASQSPLSFPLQNASAKITEASVREGPSSEKDNKSISSPYSEPRILCPAGPSTTVKMFCEKESVCDQEALVDKALNSTQVGVPIIEHSSMPKFVEIEDSAFNPVVTSSEDTSRGQTIITDYETYIDKKVEVNHMNPQFEDDDLIKLFQIIEDADIKGHMPYASEIATLEDDNKVAKAFFDVEVSLKMGVGEVASSEENIHRLENALNLLSTHYSKDGDPTSGLKVKIDSMHKEISSILSSFKLASARLSTIDTFTELEEKEKCINETLPQRKEAALTLVSEIHETKKSMAEALKKEAELKEKISRLQAELNNKEKEIKDCEIKLEFLQEKKKNSVWDTMAFLEECDAVKKVRSKIVEDKMKAKQELEKHDFKWSSCEAKWLKIILLQGIYLKQKL